MGVRTTESRQIWALNFESANHNGLTQTGVRHSISRVVIHSRPVECVERGPTWVQTAHPCKGASSAPGPPDGHPTVPCIFTQKPPTVLSPVQREITKTSLPLHSFAFEYFLCSLGLGRPAPSPSGVPAPSPPGTPRSCAASRATGSTGLHQSHGLLAVNGGLLLPPICTAVPCPWSAAAPSRQCGSTCAAAPPSGRAVPPSELCNCCSRL